MFYYINFFILYSILGFILESFFYKINNTNSHSGIFYGPYNFTYGIGMLFCLLVYNKLSLPINIFNIIIYYICFTIITTIIEYLIGNLIYYMLKIDKWDYSHITYHFGKYICLRNSLIWGLLSTLFIFIINPQLINKIIIIIPKNYTIITILLFIIDFILSFKKYFITKKI